MLPHIFCGYSGSILPYAYQLLPVDWSHGRVSAVLAVIPVVAHDKIFVVPQRDLRRSDTRILNHFPAVMLIQNFPVDVNISCIIDPDFFSGKSDDTFYVVGFILIAIRKNNDIKSFRIRETVADLLHDQLISIVQRRIHGIAHHFRPLSNKTDQKKCDEQDHHNIKHEINKPAELLPRLLMFSHTRFLFQ